VSFFEGTTALRANVPLVSGQATLNLSGVAAGAHTYRAVYTPSDAVFLGSEGTSTVTIAAAVAKAKPAIAESFPATVAKGKKAKGTVTVVGDGATATGTVKIMKGSKVLKTATLKNGKATITLPKLATGKNTLKAVYGGSGKVAGATKSFTIKQK
jgi:hypothetical protein